MLICAAIVAFGGIAARKVIQDAKNPDQITIPSFGKIPTTADLYKAPIPMSKIGKKKPTFRELW